jgi:tripartite-type tricarboxylate transporter receptor subunit TctC
MFRAIYAALLILLGISTDGVAQSFPVKPVHILIPYSAGSGVDTIVRIIADRLNRTWNQQVLVENRSGANGIVAIEALKKLPPDGYSLIVLDNSILTINPYLYAKVPYSPDKDLTPVAMTHQTPFAIMVSTSGPFKTLKDLIAYAKDNPGKLSYGSPTGVGHPAHLGMEIFKRQTGVDITLVPYKTSAPLNADVVSGTLSVGWTSLGSARPFIQSGAVRLLAVGTKARHPLMPNIPTIGEAGGPDGLVVSSWDAVFGPNGLPKELAGKIAKDIGAIQQMPDVVDRISATGASLMEGGAEQVTEQLHLEAKKHSEIIKQLNIKLE